MFDSLKGKTVLVTGGSRGIGKSIVTLLANYKLNVAFTYCNNKIDLSSLNEGLPDDRGKVTQYKLDLENKEQIHQVIKEVENDFGTIDFLVNNAGITKDGYMMLMSNENWEKVLSTNLTGTFMITKKVLPIMMAKNGGAIINISSIAGFTGVSGQTNYCSAKAGLIGFTKALSREVAHKNIRVNSIAPGYIKTDMTDKLDLKTKDAITKKVPLKRVGLAEEIASVVMFLLSDGASYISGTTVVVDGGLTS